MHSLFWNPRRKIPAVTSDMFFVPKVIESGIFGSMPFCNGLIIVIQMLLNQHLQGLGRSRTVTHSL
jgi:hypothetical protein